MAKRWLVLWVVVGLVGMVPAAWGHGISAGPFGTQDVPEPVGTALDAATRDRCDPIDPSSCLLPFPNDHFTTADPTTDTGLRLNLNLLSMPRNVAGKPIDPTEWNRNDGFSPGQLAITRIADLDPKNTALPRIDNPTESLGATSAVVAINTRTGQRHPVWAELDATPDGTFTGGTFEGVPIPSSPPTSDPAAARTLLIRPARNWDENTRYIIVVQGVRDHAGHAVPSSPVFASYRDKTPTPLGQFEGRRSHFEQIFRDVAHASGPAIDRRNVYLAWDFTVASERNLAERMLFMRDDAFASLHTATGDRPPHYLIRQVTENPSPHVLRHIEGVFSVPRYVSSPTTGAAMVYDPRTGLPLRQPTDQQATFTCNIPDSATILNPSGVSLYGHGLLGSQDEVNSDAEVDFGSTYDWTFCAANWLGMSFDDLPTVVGGVIVDLSNFHLIPDRSQQGMLDFLFLGRLMRDPNGFVKDPAFRLGDQPLINPETLVYDGNSQGGIMGGALAAIAKDFTRIVLGVTGMNYSTLLTRSSDFDNFAALLYPMYPDERERPLVMSLMQILWDRGEANGYAHHMTENHYPNTPPHRVLMEVGFGDHQVTNYSAEVEAATIGAAAHLPAPPKHWATTHGFTPYAWFSTIPSYPYAGSALFEWDSGVPAPPLENLPNRAADDPHETPRRDTNVRKQMDLFMRTGLVYDTCGGYCETVKRDG